MEYTKTNWVDNETPLNAANMNNIEQGIENATAAIADVTATVPGIVQTTGDNSKTVMSQKAATDAINSAEAAAITQAQAYTDEKIQAAIIKALNTPV